MSNDERCGTCGQVAEGLAWIGDTRYCHGDGPSLSCYEQASTMPDHPREPEHQGLCADEFARGWAAGYEVGKAIQRVESERGTGHLTSLPPEVFRNPQPAFRDEDWSS